MKNLSINIYRVYFSNNKFPLILMSNLKLSYILNLIIIITIK